MVALEVSANPNCEPMDLRVFEDLEAPRRVTHVRLAPPIGHRQAGREHVPGMAAWYEVTGWSADGAPGPALVQKVSDSGNGTALLVRGGEAGLRLRPEGSARPWRLGEPEQWGEPFLLIGEAVDARVAATTVTHG